MYDLFCIECSGQFVAVRPDKRYCSPPCAGRAGRRRRGEQTDITEAGRDCLRCSRHFDITPPNTNRRYCSEDCAREASREQRRAFHLRKPKAQKLYNSRRPYRDSRIARLRRKHPDLPTACEACGEGRIVELAHKPGFERRGAGRLASNTQRHMVWVLCPTCHKLFDNGICTQDELGLT